MLPGTEFSAKGGVLHIIDPKISHYLHLGKQSNEEKSFSMTGSW